MSHKNFFAQWQGRNFSIRNLYPLWSEFWTRNAAEAGTGERRVTGSPAGCLSAVGRRLHVCRDSEIYGFLNSSVPEKKRPLHLANSGGQSGHRCRLNEINANQRYPFPLLRRSDLQDSYLPVLPSGCE